jgi:hypothetical protein
MLRTETRRIDLGTDRRGVRERELIFREKGRKRKRAREGERQTDRGESKMETKDRGRGK